MAWRGVATGTGTMGRATALMGWNFLFSRDTQGPIIEIGINMSKQPPQNSLRGPIVRSETELLA